MPQSTAVSLPSSSSSQPTNNKLHALLGHYNSDDESSGEEKETTDAEFNVFMNEIKSAELTNNPVPTTAASSGTKLFEFNYKYS